MLPIGGGNGFLGWFTFSFRIEESSRVATPRKLVTIHRVFLKLLSKIPIDPGQISSRGPPFQVAFWFREMGTPKISGFSRLVNYNSIWPE